VKRFPFLDWMRGLAILLMIQCHSFNSWTRLDLREGGPYVLSQFIGGMAAPLFLFMAGMTLGFQMDSAARREPARWKRWVSALRRGGYVLGIAYLFRLSNCVASIPHIDWHELTKVDILNCMGLAMLCMSGAALFEFQGRVRYAVVGALAVAAAAPVIANLSWEGVPQIVQEYLTPGQGQGRGRFPLFPNAAYVGFGLAAGSIVKRMREERFDRLMQWAVLIGFAMVFAGQYFSNIPYSLYTKSSFWTDSPTLVIIRGGIALIAMAGCYVWTEYCVGPGWSWMQTLGKNSLMVYWIHVMLVYGDLIRPLKRALSIPVTALATAALTAVMVGMSVVWLGWKARRAERWRLATSVASGRAVRAV
jgi:uncharacterized membrane protein